MRRTQSWPVARPFPQVWSRREVRPLLLRVQRSVRERRHAVEGVPRPDLGLFLSSSVAVRHPRPVLLHDGSLVRPRVRPRVVQGLRPARARQRVRLLLEAVEDMFRLTKLVVDRRGGPRRAGITVRLGGRRTARLDHVPVVRVGLVDRDQIMHERVELDRDFFGGSDWRRRLVSFERGLGLCRGKGHLGRGLFRASRRLG
mmetsp:Transcript_14205/g.41877  ORF Transcript_14205/g.41877 Transcript_14205/m.41877 type:complete len:200 (-) Transcript_14205:868-1467(-)